MVLATVTFDQIILALHVMAVVVAFGVLFAEPVFMLVGARLDPATMPGYHRLQKAVGRRIINPGLLVVVVCGVILASKDHVWSEFYVQWGIGASLVIGAIEGAIVIPRAGKLAELARRDLDAGGLSAEYRAKQRQLLMATGLISLLVLLTILFMVLGPSL